LEWQDVQRPGLEPDDVVGRFELGFVGVVRSAVMRREVAVEDRMRICSVELVNVQRRQP
jgi:hypothetical protein